MSRAALSVERVRYNRAEDTVTVSKKPFGASPEEAPGRVLAGLSLEHGVFLMRLQVVLEACERILLFVRPLSLLPPHSKHPTDGVPSRKQHCTQSWTDLTLRYR
jgi:hypothetical protein